MDVRQSVWVAESAIEQYDNVLRRFMAAWQQENEPEMEVLRGEIGRLYPAIWEQLDAAAAASKRSGRDVDAYATIRTQVSLDERAHRDAKAAAKRLGISLAEFLRRAIRLALSSDGDKPWMPHAGVLATKAPDASRSVDDVVYGHPVRE